MKKRLAAILAGLMVLTFGATSVFADLSSTATELLEDAGLTDPIEVGTLSGTVTEVDTDDDGTVYTVVELTSEVEDGSYYIIIDGEVYEVVVENGVATIYGYEAAVGDELTDIVLYGENESGDDGDDGNSSGDDGDESGDAESDEMGEFSVLPLVAVAALAGVVVCGKKIKFYA